jgi:hypothetical protein
MTATSKSADQQQKSQPNLGQKEAQQNRESDAELRRMGEKSDGSSGKPRRASEAKQLGDAPRR